HVRIKADAQELSVTAVDPEAPDATPLGLLSPIWKGRRARVGGTAAIAALRKALGVPRRVTISFLDIRVSEGTLRMPFRAGGAAILVEPDRAGSEPPHPGVYLISPKAHVLHRAPPGATPEDAVRKGRAGCGVVSSYFRFRPTDEHRGRFCQNCFPGRYAPGR